MTDERLTAEEKEYLNLTDDLIRIAKTDNFRLLKPGPLVIYKFYLNYLSLQKTNTKKP